MMGTRNTSARDAAARTGGPGDGALSDRGPSSTQTAGERKHKVVRLNTLISLPLTNGGPSYTCERIVEQMGGHGIEAQIFTPADRRDEIQSNVHVRAIVPRWARKWPFRPTNRVTSRLSEYALFKSCTSGSPAAAFLWGDVSSTLVRMLDEANVFVVREKYNCAKAVAKEILRDAYESLGVPEAFPAEQYTEELMAAEMDSLRRASMIFCPSPMVAWSLTELGIPEDVLAMTSYGFDPARLAGDSQALTKTEGPTFIFAGFICVRKGAHILLEAWRRANIKGRLVLLGTLEPIIQELFADVLARNDVEHHSFTRDIGAFYRSSDYFIFPTLEEGGPQVTYEAAYCGVPSIVSPMGAGAIVRDGKEGVVLDSTDVDDWAAAIQQAANSWEAGAETGRRAHERACEFTWPRVGAQRRRELLRRSGL